MSGYQFLHHSDMDKPEEYLHAVVDMSLLLQELGICKNSICRAVKGLDVSIVDFLLINITESKYKAIKELMCEG